MIAAQAVLRIDARGRGLTEECLRIRREHDPLIALGGDVVDDADVFRRAAVVDEVADLALLVAVDVGVVAGEPATWLSASA